MVSFHNSYEYIISLPNLLCAWQEFQKGKKKRKDVTEFQIKIFENIKQIHHELALGTYQHSGYKAFRINDPKPRDIHKALVRDRVVHRALYRVLYSFFDKTFIYHSYSCRVNKGTHKALYTFEHMARKVSQNHTKTVWVLKCDIRKFFASIDHEILMSILRKKITDKDTLFLFENIIRSFHTSEKQGTGLPLGNLTIQLLVNVYMNEFDQWVKHRLKAKYYIRYADDFVILNTHKHTLEQMTPEIETFLQEHLCLTLHPKKVSIATIASGVDFLGWLHFPTHRVLRTSTKRRMFKKCLHPEVSLETQASYVGLLQHGNAYTLRTLISQNVE